MTVTCDGCGKVGETVQRQGVGRTNPINPETKQRWWSRRVKIATGTKLELACSSECREKVKT